MKLQVKCIRCGKEFWSKAKKNKFTKKVDALDNICQKCLNSLRHIDNLRKADLAEKLRAEKMLKNE